MSEDQNVTIVNVLFSKYCLSNSIQSTSRSEIEEEKR